MTIELTLNGEARRLPADTTLAQALVQWGYACDKIAVAVNGEFVARAEYARRVVKQRDQLDVVAPVQGG